MNNSIDAAMVFAAKNEGYRAMLGIITEGNIAEGILSWAALNAQTGDCVVPDMDAYFAQHPAARWQTLNPKQLREYLARHDETAFLYSQHKRA